MNSWKTKNKVIFLAANFLLLFIASTAINYWSSNKVETIYTNIEKVNLPNNTYLLEAFGKFRSARMYLLQMLLPHQSLKEIETLKGKIKSNLKEYQSLIDLYKANITTDFELAQEKTIALNMKIYTSDIDKAITLFNKSNGKEGPEMEDARLIANLDMKDHSAVFREELDKLLKFLAADAKNDSELASQTKARSAMINYFMILYATTMGVASTIFIVKNIVKTEKSAQENMEKAVRSAAMVENSPVSTMMCDPEGKIIYMNDAAKKQLNGLQNFLGEKVDKMLGKSIDIFHKNPAHVKKIISHPRNLPHKAVVTVGNDKLDLLVSASIDPQGNFLGVGLSWTIITAKLNLVTDLTRASENLAIAAMNVLTISSSLSQSAEETSKQASTASVATEQINSGVQEVANNMEEMTQAIKEITKSTNEAAHMTNEAMAMAKNTNHIINQLGDSSANIGNVIKVISSIAQQTNLLALNATIEAARAGEAGKGFAVVANEVKELANQTAKATTEITRQIETIQGDSKNAIIAIAGITDVIEKINGFTGSIAASIEEQAAATNEITRIITESAEGVRQISENITHVSQAAENTGKDASHAQGAAQGVEEIIELLNGYVHNLSA
jgi:methyl-accepting chemotaxis protein